MDKKLVMYKIIWKIGSVYAKLLTDGSPILHGGTFNQQESMIFWQFASVTGCV